MCDKVLLLFLDDEVGANVFYSSINKTGDAKEKSSYANKEFDVVLD